MTDIATLARSIYYGALNKAAKAFEREMSKPAERQPILYSGCNKPINTRERAEAQRNSHR